VIAFAVMISIPTMVPVAIIIPVAVMASASVMFPEIAVSVVVPTVIMFNPAVFSLPVTVKESLSVVMRPHPASPWVRRPSPITFMPAIMPSDRIPVALYPHELGSGGRRQNSNHADRRRRPDGDPNRDLSAEYRQGKQ